MTFVAGVLFFPLSYIFGDILTEVYGYARDRRCVWAGLCRTRLRGVHGVGHRGACRRPRNGATSRSTSQAVFGSTWRIIGASIIAFWSGSFVNSYVLAKMKIWTQGRWLWTRTIGSTICGEAVDSGLFYTLAFYGIWDNQLLLKVMAHAIRAQDRAGRS